MNANKEGVFGTVDFAVLISTLIISSTIGIYYRFSGGKQKTAEEYLLGDKRQKIVPVAFSLMTSMMSSITLLGVSAEIYMHSIQFVVINIGYIIMAPLIAYFYLPVFFKLQATSVFEYLERRFGLNTRFVASSIYFVQSILYMGVVLYAPALTLEAITGLSSTWSILVTGFVCTFYSTLGGMKAVIITDVFQMFLMFMALFIVIFTAVLDNNGLGPIWNIAKDHGRLEFFNFDLDPTTRHTFWSLVLGGGTTYVALTTTNQTQVQRFMTLKDLRTAVITLFISVFVTMCLSLTTSFSGLAIFARYKDCDPISSKRIERGDQLMPLYAVDRLGKIPGLTGLFVSGIFSAGLSSLSAIFNSLAAVSVEDYIKPAYKLLFRKPYPADQAIHLTKALACGFGVVCVAMAFLAKILGGILQASLTIFGIVGGPLLGVFTLGMFVPIANEAGALSGMIVSLLTTMWIGFGRPKPPITNLPVITTGCPADLTNYPLSKAFSNTTSFDSLPEKSQEYFYLYRVSYLWYVVIGFLLTMIVGTVVSIVFSSKRKITDLNPDLFVPMVASYIVKCQWLEEKARDTMLLKETERKRSIPESTETSCL